MGGFSWDNPFPMLFGDGPTEVQLAYEGLHEAAGVSTTSPQESALAPKDPDPLTLTSLGDLEVKCEAIAIGAAATWVEHAEYEGFPDTMIDSLSTWEKILGISPIADTIEERQAAVTLAYTRSADASNPALGETLQRLSPKLYLDSLNPDLWTQTVFGKNFSPYPNGEGVYGQYGPPYRTDPMAIGLFGRSSRWPSYGDAFRVRVRYVLGAGETQPPSSILTRAHDLLIETLPSWHVPEVYTLADDGMGGEEGFCFDGGPNGDSFFDVTAFGET